MMVGGLVRVAWVWDLGLALLVHIGRSLPWLRPIAKR
jgi:hypothetical protein